MAKRIMPRGDFLSESSLDRVWSYRVGEALSLKMIGVSFDRATMI